MEHHRDRTGSAVSVWFLCPQALNADRPALRFANAETLSPCEGNVKFNR
jgi:hypothetical protein